MQVKLITITPNAETNIVEIARVSSSRKDKKAKPEGLLNYLIEHKHWSPFEHSYMTVEIETSKAIGIQLIRHRSFTFQEFSQRYQDVNLMEGSMLEPVQVRKQAESNRQSSTEVLGNMSFNAYQNMGVGPQVVGFGMSHFEEGSKEAHVVGWMSEVQFLLNRLQRVYLLGLEAGVARECARMILPMCTKTRIHMTGSIRSWIHFLEIRDDEHAQKEIQDVAKAIKQIFVEQLPIISRALNY